MNAPRSPGMMFSVFITALGYFVDLYDIAIFGVVRVASLNELGITGQANTDWGITLLNLQMTGLFIGGLLWGVIGDRFGRRTALIATVACYSLANIANAFVVNVEQYAVLRLIAGIGLAGELGAGVALVSEILPSRHRGYGVVLIAVLGIAGSLTAAYVGGHFNWRTAYLAGGIAGLFVLAGRIWGLRESALFEQSKHVEGRGDWGVLVRNRSVMLRMLAVVAVGIPIWFVSGLLVNFAPEFGRALGMAAPLTVSSVAILQGIGVGIGNVASGVFSERLRTRKAILWVCLGGIPLLTGLLLTRKTPEAYAQVMFLMGLTQGYWSVYLTMAAEQFGTNVRAMVSIAVPNFVRVTTVPIMLTMGALAPGLGWLASSILVGAAVLLLAWLGLRPLKETYGLDLDYFEPVGRPLKT